MKPRGKPLGGPQDTVQPLRPPHSQGRGPRAAQGAVLFLLGLLDEEARGLQRADGQGDRITFPEGSKVKIPIERIEQFTALAKSEASPAMKAVWLDVAGSRMLATDGHMAMRVEVSVEEEDESGLIPVEAFELSRKELQVITKLQGKENIPDPWLKIVCNPDVIFIENLLTNTKHLVDRPKVEDGKGFPNIDAIFPELKTEPTARVSLDLIARVAKNIDPSSVSVSLFIGAPDKVITMATESGKGAVALMPMLGNSAGFYKVVNLRAVPPAAVSE